MSQALLKRSGLLVSCGSGALALGLMFGPGPVAAQGIQATGNVVFGGAGISQPLPDTTAVDVFTPPVVIDWTPLENAAGDALTFLPAGSAARYETGQLFNFAVLNRILPSTNGNIVEINGAVTSRVLSAAGPVPGGFVAFYSPTGLLIGGTATFDVGQLLLTTLNTADTNFQNFAELGSTLQLAAAQGSTARIQILPGAQILAARENGFFAVVAADVEMRGVARVNGSHAYVAGEVVNLSFSNGLFNISVPVGTAAAGEVVTLNGTVGGPSSTGATGDNHMIYAVARASQDPISMLFRGNLGFDPAQSAGVVNGEIILAANYNVFGRNVDGGNISNGVNAVFGGNTELTTVRADIALEDFAASSSLLAIGTHRTTAAAVNAASSAAGNLLLVGRELASLTASNNRNLTIAGDVLVSAQDYGVTSSGLQSLDSINASGGTARLEAFGGGSINVAGQARVLADAFAGADDLNQIAGTAQGGQARLGALGGGTVTIGSDVLVRAAGFGTNVANIQVGATARGGSAELFARSGGGVTINGSAIVDARAIGANGSEVNPSTPSDAFGGQALITVADGGGTITVLGSADADASATSRSVNAAGAGALADAGVASASIAGPGTIGIGGDLRLTAAGRAGNNAGGTGGIGLGGRASATTLGGGTINVGAGFRADAIGFGGNGLDGGAGSGGIAGANAVIGTIAIVGDANAESDGTGGDASFGVGGIGGLGRGGNSFFQADGTLTQTARVTIGGNASAFARGFGGRGGQGSISTGPQGGRGGDGIGGQFAVPNQADPAFTSGAFLLAGGDNGTLIITGAADAVASGFGGEGGTGGIPGGGGRGGDGTGGLAQVGLALLGQNGSLGLGLASFNTVNALSDGIGGFGGTSFGAPGIGGDGTGGASVFSVSAGDATATEIDLSATGFGGFGATGGTGRGGQVSVLGSLGGTLTATDLSMGGAGFGGGAQAGAGGNAFGGNVAINGDAITVTVNGNALLDASAIGGGSTDGAGGNSTGGTAFAVAATTGVISITGHAQIFANAFGGSTATSFAGGNALGGLAYAEALGGGALSLGSVQVGAVGRGGSAATFEGGNGTGGIVRLRASGSGSRLTILRNLPAGFAADSPAGNAILNASGIGGATEGGSGIGGLGRGGTVEITASLGGSVNLPVNILNDPDRVADTMFIFARGTGGNSNVEDGTGGGAVGGTINLLVDGGTLVSGTATPSTLSQGGNSGNSSLNITGGDATAGLQSIRVINGGTLTIETQGGGASAQGGNGSGTGNGGNAVAGAVLFEVINATANLAGRFSLFNESFGGTGERGGNAGGGSITVNTQNAQINLSPSPTSPGILSLQSSMIGGAGLIAGGNAQGTTVNVTLAGTQITGGGLTVEQIAIGGAASATNGVGGNAIGAAIQMAATNSALTLTGPLGITASAIGGDGGTSGQGGSGTGGTANLSLTGTSLTVVPGGSQSPANIAIRADGTGGQAGTVGNSFGGTAALGLSGGSITAAQIEVTAQGSSLGQAGQISGNATGGAAQIAISGASTLNATNIVVAGSAVTGPAGTVRGGTAGFAVASGSAATVNATSLGVFADAAGGATNRAGQFLVTVGGGNVNLGALDAAANGGAVTGDPAPSQLVADGGNINVAGQLRAVAAGDLVVRSGQGGIIGSAATAGTVTTVALNAGGTIQILGDGSATGGLGGQTIGVQAGRSILLGGNLATRDGAISLTANSGGGQLLSQPPASVITMAQGSRINAGTGTVTIRLLDGAGDPQRVNGAIQLANITAGRIDVRNFGTSAGSNISVLADGVLTASGAGRAIDLASLNGEVINLAGDAGLVLTGGGHYGIFAATPTGSQIGSFSTYARRYNVANAAAYDTLNPGGNFAAFRIVPFLTVTPTDATRFYGSANPAFTASYTGFLPGDGVANLSGAPQLTTLATGTSNVGTFAINIALGSLLSEQGYQFVIGNPGLLTITPRPITVTADNLTRIYGNANPALGFTVGGLGLVNGDQLTGALTTAAGAATGVGNVAITQGSLAATANYALTFVNGQLTITPRPITVTADNLSKLLGLRDPAFTFTIGGDGLVNGDQLTGNLTRDPGERIGVFDIRQGSLTAGPNYAATFVGGQLTIDAPPVPPEINSATVVISTAAGIDTVPDSGEAEDEERFGIEFPERPDAVLIAEDPLLDDPVASGGDASLYSGGAVPPAGGK